MGEFYHVLNRGVDKRKIFLDKQDYFRFVHDLFEFNDQAIINTSFHTFQRIKDNDIASRNIKSIEFERRPRKLLVDIYAFCLMPNHYHLLLSARVENGISRFMKKLDMGYAKYFNQKYKRKGTLFEARYKRVPVEKEPHFYYLPYYIHLNPLDIKFPEWREGSLRNYRQALKFLEDYRWSSHLDYIGIKNFPSVTSRHFLIEVFGGARKYKQSIEQWLRDLDLDRIKEFILEQS